MLNEEITVAQFLEWQAYHALDPWGEYRDDLRMGVLASILVGAFGRGRPPKPEAFVLVPDPGRKERQRTEVADVDGMKAILGELTDSGFGAWQKPSNET